MRVSDVMTKRVQTIAADDFVRGAREKMQATGLHQLVVRDRRRRVVGVIARADVHEAPDRARIQDFMSRTLITIAPSAPIRAAAGQASRS
ncbi:MAG TPA: CBS domain-containing protein, partial [Vicinamibacterales bacterium]|nr:CBS domain-containing protein [Vicinamibacterales bacterium]